MDYNKSIIVGRLASDPTGKALEGGGPVTTFSVATNQRWTKDGQPHEEVEFHNVVVFGKLGQTCATHLRKADTVLIEGRLKTRSWETDGVRRYFTEIIAERVVFGPKPMSAGHNETTLPQSPREVRQDIILPDYPESEISPEDIPF